MFQILIEESHNISLPGQKFLQALEMINHDILKQLYLLNHEYSILLCNNSFIQELNNSYRKKNYPTDVLSFVFDKDSTQNIYLGDIIISTDKAQEQAIEYNIIYEEELARLIIHGLLHLIGFNHEKDQESSNKMFSIQDQYMNKFMQLYKGHNSSLI